MIIFTVSEPGSRANRWGSLCILKKRQHKIIKKKVCLICWRLSYFGYPCKTPLRQTSYTGQINQQEFPWNSSLFKYFHSWAFCSPVPLFTESPLWWTFWKKQTNKQTSGCNARKHWQWPETRMFGKGGGVSSWPCLQHKLPMNTNNQIDRKTWGCYLKNDCYEFISSSGVKSFWSNTIIHFWLYTDINIYGQAVHWKLTRQTTCLVSLKCHQLFNVLCSCTLQLKWFTISTT